MRIVTVLLATVCLANCCWAQISADLNNDLMVDFYDLAIMADHWLQAADPPPPPPMQGETVLYNDIPSDFLYDNFNQPIAVPPYNAGDTVWRCEMDDKYRWVSYASVIGNISASDAASNYSRTDGKMIVQVATDPCASADAYFFWGPEPNEPPPPLEKCFCKIKYYIPLSTVLPTGITFAIGGKNDSSLPREMFIPLPIKPGEHNVEFCLSALGQTDENLGDPNPPADGLIADFNNLSYIKLAMNGDPNVTVYWDSIEFIRNADRPKMVLTFDDGYLNQYEVIRPILNNRNIKAAFYVLRDKTLDPNSGSGYIDVNQVQQLYEGGHLIGSHGAVSSFWDPSADWTHKQQEEANDILSSRMWLKTIGVETGYYYAPHSGSDRFDPLYEPPGTNQEKALLRKNWIGFVTQNNLHVRMTQYIKWVDGTICSTEQDRIQRHVFPNPGNFRNLDYAVRPTSFDVAKYMMDAAIRDNGLVSFYWHQIGPGLEMSEEDFTAIIDYAIAHNFEFVTWKDLLSENQ